MKLSLYRELEYKRIWKLSLDWTILDLWWSRKSGYQELINWKNKFIVVNLSEEYWYDLKFDLEKIFPLEDEFYDNITCFNVLEHIFEHQNVVDESYRVLKKWWTAVFATPFMFNVHGSPDDYFRYTKSSLLRIFIKWWFSKNNIQIEEMWKWIFSVIYQMINWLIPTKILKLLIKNILILIDILLAKISKRYKKLILNYPLWYFIIIKK